VNAGVQQDIIYKDMLLEECRLISNESVYHGCNISEVIALYSVYNVGARLKTKQCTEDGLNFFCNAISFLCDDQLEDYTPSLSEECVQTRDDNCVAEWRIVENLFNLSLPECSSFNDNINLTVSNASILSCPDDFSVFCGLCFPLCQSPLPRGVRTAYTAVTVVLFIISIVGGVIALIASIRKRKQM